MKRFLLITGLLFGFGILLFSQTYGGLFFVEWGDTTLTYNGYPQAPPATVFNGQGATVNMQLYFLGKETDVGKGYVATAIDNDPNFIDIYLYNNQTGFEIVPATITVQWGNTSLPYNSAQQAPTATATGVLGEDLQLTVTGLQTYVGTGYTAKVSLLYPNKNYVLADTTIMFDIVPAPITIQWGNTSLLYNGMPQAPTATATGIWDEQLLLTVTGAQTDIGTGYTATASFTYPISYYVLANPTTPFNIVPASAIVNIQWSNTSLTYNGVPQAPTATATGPDGEDLPLIVTGAQTDAGKGYTATASLVSPSLDFVLNNTTTLFDIAPAPITVQWDNTSFAYNGSPQAPTATATGVLNEDLPLTVTGAQTNAGTGYTATASANTNYNNYSFNNLTTLFDITQETLAIAAVNVTIEQGQSAQLEYNMTSGNLFGSDALTGSLAVETQNGVSLQPPYPTGTHIIVQGTLTAGSNYLIDFSEGTLTVIGMSPEIFDIDILVNGLPTERKGDIFYFIAGNGEDQASINVVTNLTNPGDIISIDGQQNPLTVMLSNYGDNSFVITVKPLNETPQNFTLVIERYYEKVVFEYPDVPTINCNNQTNGGFNFTGFQWYRAGIAITEATGPFLQVKDNATYHCELSHSNGVKFRTINILPHSLRSSGSLMAYPNPTQGKITILRKTNRDYPLNELTGKTNIQVLNLNGVIVMQPATNPFDMSTLPAGMYFINVNGEMVKVIKTN